MGSPTLADRGIFFYGIFFWKKGFNKTAAVSFLVHSVTFEYFELVILNFALILPPGHLPMNFVEMIYGCTSVFTSTPVN